MKRMEFFQLAQPLTDKLYRLAYVLLPDDLQAEQLVIDGTNAYLIKEKNKLLSRELNFDNKKEVLLARRSVLKGIIKYINEIGVRRSLQLMDQMRLNAPGEFRAFYGLDPKVRMALTLRYDFQFTVEEIQDLMLIPRYEVIEKLHNGRYLLLNHRERNLEL
jgi:hypothetical protein